MKLTELDRAFAARGWLSLQLPAFRRHFLELGRLVSLQRGDPVFHMGDEPGGVYGIVSGAIGVLGGTSHQLPVLSHIERAGDWFGFGPVLSGGLRILTFTAMEPTCLLQVPLLQLRAGMKSDPDFSARIAHMADIATATVIGVARDLLIPGAAERLTAVLLRVTAHGEVAPGHRDGYAMSQTELGEMANISRHQVNRILALLQRSGWVRLGYNRIALLDVPALRAFAYAEK